MKERINGAVAACHAAQTGYRRGGGFSTASTRASPPVKQNESLMNRSSIHQGNSTMCCHCIA
ncbi:MAG: hypothetical protein QM702_05135 [Rubrivivax sp.]